MNKAIYPKNKSSTRSEKPPNKRANVFAAWLGAADYPKARLTKAWCDFIRHEFHDDLTGTSVLRAYRETFHDDIVVNNTLDGEITATVRKESEIERSDAERSAPAPPCE